MSITYKQLNEMLFEAALEERIPLSGDFELTPRCNLNCVMCYVRKAPGDVQVKSEELSAKEWLDIATQARDAGMLYLLLTGGEIFIRQDIREIYEGVTQLGLIVTLYTNGTLINEEIANWLAMAPPRKVSITLYGASPETYERITGHRDGLERALRAVELLRERNIIVELKTIMLEGTKEDIIPLFDYAFEREIHFSIVNYVFPTREENDADPIGNRLSPEDAARLEKNILDYVRINVEERNENKNKVLDECSEISHNPDENHRLKMQDINSAFKCNTGKTSFWMTWKGILTPCGIMKDITIDCKQLDFKMAWEELNNLMGEIPINAGCKNCEYNNICLSCPARLQIETGYFTEVSDYLCRNAKERYNINKK